MTLSRKLEILFLAEYVFNTYSSSEYVLNAFIRIRCIVEMLLVILDVLRAACQSLYPSLLFFICYVLSLISDANFNITVMLFQNFMILGALDDFRNEFKL